MSVTEVPFSEWPGEPYGFPRHYPPGPGREQRIAGDQQLLVLLTEQCRRRRSPDGRAATVGDLSDGVLRSIVEEVEELHFGSWKVEGGDNDGIREALDEHFRPLHDAWAAERRQQDSDLLRRMSENALIDEEAAARNAARDAAVWGLPA
jgi:hypothetical protein